MNRLFSIFLTVLLLMLYGLPVQAQRTLFTTGVEEGLGLDKLYGNPTVAKQSADLAGGAGMFFQYNFPKVVSLATGFYFDRKGVETKFEYPAGVTRRNHYYFNYLTFPALVRTTFGKKVKFFLSAGPYASVLVNSYLRARSLTDNVPHNYDNTSTYRRADFGVMLGAGVSIPVTFRFAFTGQVRNSVGLINISKQGVIKTYSTLFLVGFEYNFGTVMGEAPPIKNGTYK